MAVLSNDLLQNSIVKMARFELLPLSTNLWIFLTYCKISKLCFFVKKRQPRGLPEPAATQPDEPATAAAAAELQPVPAHLQHLRHDQQHLQGSLSSRAHGQPSAEPRYMYIQSSSGGHALSLNVLKCRRHSRYFLFKMEKPCFSNSAVRVVFFYCSLFIIPLF